MPKISSFERPQFFHCLAVCPIRTHECWLHRQLSTGRVVSTCFIMFQHVSTCFHDPYHSLGQQFLKSPCWRAGWSVLGHQIYSAQGEIIQITIKLCTALKHTMAYPKRERKHHRLFASEMEWHGFSDQLQKFRGAQENQTDIQPTPQKPMQTGVNIQQRSRWWAIPFLSIYHYKPSKVSWVDPHEIPHEISPFLKSRGHSKETRQH